MTYHTFCRLCVPERVDVLHLNGLGRVCDAGCQRPATHLVRLIEDRRGRCNECARLVPEGARVVPEHRADGRLCLGSGSPTWVPNGIGANLTIHGEEPAQIAYVACEECDRTGRPLYAWCDDVVCEDCARAGMEHGHRHVHDSPYDCVAELRRVDGRGGIVLRCDVPVENDDWREVAV